MLSVYMKPCKCIWQTVQVYKSLQKNVKISKVTYIIIIIFIQHFLDISMKLSILKLFNHAMKELNA